MIYADDQYTFDFNMNNSTTISTYPNITTISTGTLSTSLTSPVWTGTPYTINTSPKTFRVEYDTIIDGDLILQGVNLNDRLTEIEKRLAILRPNNDLENRWQELKELGEKYRELEKDILEKEQIWETLKK